MEELGPTISRDCYSCTMPAVSHEENKVFEAIIKLPPKFRSYFGLCPNRLPQPVAGPLSDVLAVLRCHASLA